MHLDRCTDIPVTHRGRRAFCLPLLVIPGPSEPPSMAPYLRHTLEAFQKYGPFGSSMDVEQHNINGTTSEVMKSTIQHRIFLSGITADTPANRKLSSFFSHTSYMGCPYCWLKGSTGPTGHGMYFPGYSAPTHTGCPFHLKSNELFAAVPSVAHAGDDNIKTNLTRIAKADELKANKCKVKGSH